LFILYNLKRQVWSLHFLINLTLKEITTDTQLFDIKKFGFVWQKKVFGSLRKELDKVFQVRFFENPTNMFKHFIVNYSPFSYKKRIAKEIFNFQAFLHTCFHLERDLPSGQVDVTCPSVTSFSAHTSRARGLKFGRNNNHIGGSRFTNQVFDILSRSWDI